MIGISSPLNCHVRPQSGNWYLMGQRTLNSRVSVPEATSIRHPASSSQNSPRACSPADLSSQVQSIYRQAFSSSYLSSADCLPAELFRLLVPVSSVKQRLAWHVNFALALPGDFSLSALPQQQGTPVPYDTSSKVTQDPPFWKQRWGSSPPGHLILLSPNHAHLF